MIIILDVHINPIQNDLRNIQNMNDMKPIKVTTVLKRGMMDEMMNPMP